MSRSLLAVKGKALYLHGVQLVCANQGNRPLKPWSHLDLAYATTIHKSQGGQYDSVLLSIQNLHSRMLKRPLIYTGLTRTRCRALIVGDEKAVRQAIQTTDTERRNTLLAARITQTVTS